MKAKRRFETHAEVAPERIWGLSDDHVAVQQSRTLFPSTVVEVADSPRVFVSGVNSKKIGSHVTKGPWSGMPIYTLTLEERATCPRSCLHWNDCYGNAMHWARRHRHGPELEARIETELAALSLKHKRGFVVRLHVLGDFYSQSYAIKWAAWMVQFSQLRIFGYTAHEPDSEIGFLIGAINSSFPKRWHIRFSGVDAVAAYSEQEAADMPGIVCPAMTGKTDCCGTCALCWNDKFKATNIIFIAHGPKRKGSK